MDDAKMDEILTRAEAAHGFKPSPEEEAAAKAAKTPDKGADAKQGETPAGDSSPKPTADQLKTARSVLARDGWDPDDFEGQDPARLVRLAEKAAKRQADVDGKLSKRGREDRGTTGQDTPEAKDGDTAEPKPGAKAPAFVLDREAFKAEIAALTSEFGPASDRVVGFTEKVVQRFAEGMAPEVERQIAEATAIVPRLVGLVEQMVLSTDREALKGEIPELADDTAFQEVREEMERQARVHRAIPLRELMKLSSRIVLGDQIEARRTAELKARDRAKDNGSVDLDGAAGTPTPEVLDVDALEDAWIAELDRPKHEQNPEKIQAARDRFERARIAKREAARR
jgi:hypothetical protein